MSIIFILYHLMRADFLERIRRYSFLVTIGLAIFAAFLYVPPATAGYLTVGLGRYRGIYNSAWVGSTVAILASALLSLPGFYLVKNAVERDEQTGVGQIIATTPMSRFIYTLGKALSNFAILTLLVPSMAIAAGGLQFLRGENWQLDLWALLSPFVFVTLPTMAVISSLAVLFETSVRLRSTASLSRRLCMYFALLGKTLPKEQSKAIERRYPMVNGHGPLFGDVC